MPFRAASTGVTAFLGLPPPQAYGDSFYEYLIKYWRFHGGKASWDSKRQIFDEVPMTNAVPLPPSPLLLHPPNTHHTTPRTHHTTSHHTTPHHTTPHHTSPRICTHHTTHTAHTTSNRPQALTSWVHRPTTRFAHSEFRIIKGDASFAIVWR